MQPNDREYSHLHFLSLIIAFTNWDVPALLHLYSVEKPLACQLEAWALSSSSFTEGALCCKNLATPIGVVPKTRVRESDVIAIEINLSDLQHRK